jgi:hypothetical protein
MVVLAQKRMMRCDSVTRQVVHPDLIKEFTGDFCDSGRPAYSGLLGACVEQSDDTEQPVEALTMAGGLPKFTATVCTSRWCFTDRQPTTVNVSGRNSISPGNWRTLFWRARA